MWMKADENHLPDPYLLENHRRCLHVQAIQGGTESGGGWGEENF